MECEEIPEVIQLGAGGPVNLPQRLLAICTEKQVKRATRKELDSLQFGTQRIYLPKSASSVEVFSSGLTTIASVFPTASLNKLKQAITYF